MKSFLQKTRPVHYAWLICLGFAVVYGSISLYNHYVFRTSAHDLGIKNQAIYDYAHFRWNYNTVMNELGGEINILANHFEPILFILAPFWYLFGSYTLLIFQIVFILAGGWGIYLYLRQITDHKILPLIAMAAFYGTWGIYSALSFDFHTNVLGAMLVPWIMLFMEKKKPWTAFIFLFLLINCKENMALWAVFIGAGLAVHYWKNKTLRWFSLGFSMFSLVYFVLIMAVFMPYFSQGKLEYIHFQYSALGDGPIEAIRTVVTKPLYTLRLLFVNHLPEKTIFNDTAKTNLHIAVLLSGGIFLLVKPQFLVMLIPVYGQKMFSDDPGKWSVFGQYSIEFTPVLIICAFLVISKIRNEKIMLLTAILVFLSCLDTAKDKIDKWKPGAYWKVTLNFYSLSHYRTEIDVPELYRAMDLIPDTAAVCASSMIVPHIAGRRDIYYYPYIDKANWVIYMNDGYANYPLDSADYKHSGDTLLQSQYWDIIYHQNHTLVGKRISPLPQ